MLAFLIVGIPLVSFGQNQTITCPQNLICTPIPPQPAGCPVGFTCKLNIVGTDPNVAVLITNTSTYSPVAKSVLPDSNVLLGVFEITDMNKTSTLKSISFNIPVSGRLPADIFNNLYIKSGDKIVPADSISSNPKFSNIDKILSRDTTYTLAVYGDVKSNTPDNTKVYVRLNAANSTIYAVDSDGVAAKVTEQISTSSTTTFVGKVAVSNVSAKAESIDNGTSRPNLASINIEFNVDNLSNKDVFISKNPNIALSTSSTPINSIVGLKFATPNPQILSGDTAESYVIPANSSRKFSYLGVMLRPVNGGAVSFKISRLKYGFNSKNGLPEPVLATPNTNTESNTTYDFRNIGITYTLATSDDDNNILATRNLRDSLVASVFGFAKLILGF